MTSFSNPKQRTKKCTTSGPAICEILHTNLFHVIRYNEISSVLFPKLKLISNNLEAMGRQGGCKKHPKSGAPTATDPNLLNFYFSSDSATQRQGDNGGGGRDRSRGGRGNRNSHQRRQNSRKDSRSKEDRVSVRRKPSSAMFYLHSSPDHGFVITRRPGKMQQHQYTFNGPDSAVSWDSVRIVKYLSSTTEDDDGASCPICLDSLLCARITKCGHCFCLPCIIRHVHSFNESNPYADAPKCPCCGIPLHLDDLRPVDVRLGQPPAVNHAVRLVKLHRSKGCPCPFLPYACQPRRLARHAAPCQTDADAPFSKFNYVDPDVYQSFLMDNLNELEGKERVVGDNMDALCHNEAVNRILKQIQDAMEEAEEESALMKRFKSPTSGIYQHHPEKLLAKTRSSDASEGDNEPMRRSAAVLFDDDTMSQKCGNDNEDVREPQPHAAFQVTAATRYRGDSVCSFEEQHSLHSQCNFDDVSQQQKQRQRGCSISSSVSDLDFTDQQSHPVSPGSIVGSRGRTKTDTRIGGSMYLDNDETAFYQAEDGSLCFLCGFNMKCLQSDYSSMISDGSQEELITLPSTAGTASHSQEHRIRKSLPLPDRIEGKVLEVTKVHVTPDIRQRYRFLSHIPLHSDVTFVEIDLGYLLSTETKKAFKKDFAKRKQVRSNRVNAQKREDKRTRRKEEERVNELKARFQAIDPNDVFFHCSAPEAQNVALVGEGFGPVLSTSTGETRNASSPPSNLALSFSNITSVGGAVSRVHSTEANFPSLGGAPISKKAPPPQTWVHTKPSFQPASMDDRAKSASASTMVPKDAKKKSSKGDKIVLFSTGSHRGSSY